jgi:serine protease Do
MASGFGEIAERLRRSTVVVRAGRSGLGSGVLWNGGTVITNAHVATTDQPVVELWDGRTVTGRLLARDRRRDLAVVEIGAPDLVTAPAGDSSLLRAGTLVLAIGNPLGFSGALTRGVVHAVGQVPGMGRQTWVQAGVQLAPGNSGGPLADAHGRVVGINTMLWRGLGLAVPSNAVAEFLRRGAPSRVELGVSIQPVEWNRGVGLVVLAVQQGSPAEAASLILGDVLVGAEGRRFTSPDDLLEQLESTLEILHLEFLRGERTTVRTVAVRLPIKRTAAA